MLIKLNIHTYIVQKHDKFVYTYSEQARLHFVKFETKYIENCLDFIGENLVNSDERKGKSIKATGGGAYKYSKLIQDKLGLKCVQLLFVKYILIYAKIIL